MKKIFITFLILFSIIIQAQEVGYATWYGNAGSGSRTANGERFSENHLTCAAASHYKFGTMLRVTNLNNDKSVIVKVTDRGSSISKKTNKLIDLTKLAFSKIASLRSGKIKIKIEILKDIIE